MLENDARIESSTLAYCANRIKNRIINAANSAKSRELILLMAIILH